MASPNYKLFMKMYKSRFEATGKDAKIPKEQKIED